MHKKIRIAHIMYSFTGIGGLENGVINIINNLDEDRFFHVVCSLTAVGEITGRIFRNNVKFVEIHKKEGNDIRLPFKLYSVLKREKIDLVHLRNWAALVEGFLGAKAAGIKGIIYSEHGRHFEDAWKKQSLKFHIKRYLFSKVDVLLAVSQNLADEMARLYRLDRKIHVIINGVDTQKFKPASCRSSMFSHVKPKTKILGTVARLDPGKNIDQLIMDIASVSNFPLHLVIAGDGPERAKLENLVKENNIHEKVTLLGNCNDIPRLLNCLDIFVLPSVSEGLSNVILEAMASGLPVVVYDVGGNKELVQNGKGGFLVPLRDREGFMEAVLRILKDKTMAKTMGRFNRDLVLNKFSLEKMICSYAELYSSSFPLK